jgi:hypothetical protein
MGDTDSIVNSVLSLRVYERIVSILLPVEHMIYRYYDIGIRGV